MSRSSCDVENQTRIKINEKVKILKVKKLID